MRLSWSARIRPVVPPGELYEYAQFLQEGMPKVVLQHPYHAPLRDPNDLDVMQTAERGEADVLCSNDRDFHEAGIVTFCTARVSRFAQKPRF